MLKKPFSMIDKFVYMTIRVLYFIICFSISFVFASDVYAGPSFSCGRAMKDPILPMGCAFDRRNAIDEALALHPVEEVLTSLIAEFDAEPSSFEVHSFEVASASHTPKRTDFALYNGKLYHLIKSVVPPATQVGTSSSPLRPNNNRKLLPIQIPGDRKIVQLATSKDSAYVLAEDGRIFAWGNNQWGQLGDGTEEAQEGLVQVQVPLNKKFKTLATIPRMESAAFAITDQGEVYSWGSNLNGILGNGERGGRQSVPQVVRGLEGQKIVNLATDILSVYAINDRGEVFSWGNSARRLRQSHVDQNLPTREVIATGRRFTQIIAHHEMAFALTDSGEVYAWGNNHYGQLGNGSKAESSVPTQVKIPTGKKVVRIQFDDECDISDNYPTGYAFTDKGEVYTWGANLLAGPKSRDRHTRKAVTIPRLIQAPQGEKITHIASGQMNTFVSTASGIIYNISHWDYKWAPAWSFPICTDATQNLNVYNNYHDNTFYWLLKDGGLFVWTRAYRNFEAAVSAIEIEAEEQKLRQE